MLVRKRSTECGLEYSAASLSSATFAVFSGGCVSGCTTGEVFCNWACAVGRSCGAWACCCCWTRKLGSPEPICDTLLGLDEEIIFAVCILDGLAFVTTVFFVTFDRYFFDTPETTNLTPSVVVMNWAMQAGY